MRSALHRHEEEWEDGKSRHISPYICTAADYRRQVTQKATYIPPALLSGSMQKVDLKGFDSLTSLTVGQTGLSRATAVLFLDDFTYSTFPF